MDLARLKARTTDPAAPHFGLDPARFGRHPLLGKAADEADKGQFFRLISQDFAEFWNDLDQWHGCFGLRRGLNLYMRFQVLSAAGEPKDARAR